MSAPHNFQCMAAHRESTKLLDSFRSVGLSVAIRPNSGSCQPTKTSLAFGVCCFSSGSEDFFHTNTHLAFIILSIGIPLDLQIVVTLFSTHEFHSFCMAFSNNFLSWSFNFRKFTSTLRCLAAAGVAMKHSSSTPHRKWESSHTSVANTSRDTSRTCSTFLPETRRSSSSFGTGTSCGGRLGAEGSAASAGGASAVDAAASGTSDGSTATEDGCSWGSIDSSTSFLGE